MNEKKMLHERLRNLKTEGCTGDILADAVRGAEVDCSVDCIECIKGVMKALANEIEREYIPRHMPKVLDADGVETKVGDIVYNVNSGVCVPVIEITSNRRIKWRNSGGGTGFWEPEECTHERPVFDYDSVRICKGDTVWHITRGEKHTVEHVDGENGGIFIEGDRSIFNGVEFTHREPDSLETLRDDFNTALDECDRYVDEEFQEKYQRIFDRLTALIERGA